MGSFSSFHFLRSLHSSGNDFTMYGKQGGLWGCAISVHHCYSVCSRALAKMNIKRDYFYWFLLMYLSLLYSDPNPGALHLPHTYFFSMCFVQSMILPRIKWWERRKGEKIRVKIFLSSNFSSRKSCKNSMKIPPNTLKLQWWKVPCCHVGRECLCQEVQGRLPWTGYN